MALEPCRECGQPVSTQAPACPKCGVPHPTPTQVDDILARTPAGSGKATMVYPHDPPRDPAWIAAASLLLPGLGQIICGQTKKGFAILGSPKLPTGCCQGSPGTGLPRRRPRFTLDAIDGGCRYRNPIGDREWHSRQSRGRPVPPALGSARRCP